MIKDQTFRALAIFAFIYCLILALCFKPISVEALGDAPDYIELAKQFAGIADNSVDLSHRQPLFSLFIAPLILLFGEEGFLYPMMYLQYAMMFASSLLVYQLFRELDLHQRLPIIVALLYLFNLSNIFYAYNSATETIAQFIFLLLVYVLVINAQERKNTLWAAVGLLAGLLVLARFNMIGLPLVILVCILIIHYRAFGLQRVAVLFKSLVFYAASLLLVINAWCMYNYTHRGFYGVFPVQHSGQRWAIPATITEANTVSPEYQHMLEIFVLARSEHIGKKNETIIKKGSFLKYEFFQEIKEVISPPVSGYAIYLLALPELLDYYQLENTAANVADLGSLLMPFYQEIARQNQKELFKLRLYSLMNTFRASGVILPVEESINLNILPGFLVQLYKVVVFGALFLLHILALIHFLVRIGTIRTYQHWRLILLILLIAYFPAIHFYANVIGDANRFKFLAEPIMIGLLVYYFFQLILWVKEKWDFADLFKRRDVRGQGHRAPSHH